MQGILFWVWLSRCCTPGSGTFDLLLRAFDSPYEIYTANEAELRQVLSRYDKDLPRLLDKDTTAAEKTLHFCNVTGVGLIPYDDPRYPTALRSIASPPVLLYCRGILPQMNGRLSVAVVGTRKMSDYGKRMAFEISRDLARAGAIVVSGLALGIDGVANAAAINGGGETVAVLGSGIDIIYPSAHARLADAVSRHGAVITEFAPGTRPEGRNFPIRNRIISGLAQATAVIEADRKSGALITARKALQQERILYALPGRVDEAGSEGPSILLRDGARLLTSADDILTDFEKLYSDKINIFRLLERSPFVIDAVLKSMKVYTKEERKTVLPHERKPEPPAPTPPIKRSPSEEERIAKVLSALGPQAEKLYRMLPSDGGISCDEIADSGIPIPDVLAITASLEIEGLLEVMPGGSYRKF